MKKEKLKIVTVFGTRPEAIKMAPLVLELQRYDEIEVSCCVTAQHREMLDSVLGLFGVTPRFDLNIMERGQTLSTITTKTLQGMEGVFRDYRPDLMLVHGDTTTTFAGALSAFYHGVTVGHVEAGLRTWDKRSPFPEELNRTMVSAMAELHFCPTRQNRENLAREGISKGVFVTGNTVIDALGVTVRKDHEYRSPQLGGLAGLSGRLVLLTAHRRENYGVPMQNIFTAVREVVEKHPDVHVCYPVHPSPSVRGPAYEMLGGVERIHLIDPVDVDDMHNLMDRSYLVLTDSGGLQEEAPAWGTPGVVLRRETERPEAVAAGTVKVAGVETRDIVRLADSLLSSREEYDKMAKAVNPYGDGKACRRIAQAVLWHFGLRQSPMEEFGG